MHHWVLSAVAHINAYEPSNFAPQLHFERASGEPCLSNPRFLVFEKVATSETGLFKAASLRLRDSVWVLKEAVAALPLLLPPPLALQHIYFLSVLSCSVIPHPPNSWNQVSLVTPPPPLSLSLHMLFFFLFLVLLGVWHGLCFSP